jgi:hypothetical protein
MRANAILVRPLDAGTSGDHAMAVLFGSNDKSQHMTAIRFTDESPTKQSSGTGDGGPSVWICGPRNPRGLPVEVQRVDVRGVNHRREQHYRDQGHLLLHVSLLFAARPLVACRSTSPSNTSA